MRTIKVTSWSLDSGWGAAGRRRRTMHLPLAFILSAESLEGEFDEYTHPTPHVVTLFGGPSVWVDAGDLARVLMALEGRGET